MTLQASVPLSVFVALALGLAGATACKVINPDHCANQALPGDVWCRTTFQSTNFCSPCVSNFRGCVTFQPINCNDYDPAIFDGGDDSGSDEGSDTATTGG